MANQTLTGLFTDIANAIRIVNGSKDSIPALDFPNIIKNTLSWGKLAELSAKCAEGDPAEYEHMLGFTKDVAVSGVGTVKARLIGLNHDTFADGKTAGFTFQFTDGLSTTAPVSFKMNSDDTNSGGWASSLMRSTNLPKLKAALPSDLQGVIKKVAKKTSTANSGTAVSSTEDDLFLLSLVESIGTTKTSYTSNPITSSSYLNFEGSQYEYYKKFDTGQSAAWNAHIIKDAGGSNRWWLRSISSGNTTRFHNMSASGDWGYRDASRSCLPAAAFCIAPGGGSSSSGGGGALVKPEAY